MKNCQAYDESKTLIDWSGKGKVGIRKDKTRERSKKCGQGLDSGLNAN